MALIIDMELPKACVWGKASNVLDVCNMIHRCPYAKASAEKRPEGCLIKGEIPDKHGRLIDADEFKASIHMNHLDKFATNRDVQVLYKLLNIAPTILEASE